MIRTSKSAKRKKGNKGSQAPGRSGPERNRAQRQSDLLDDALRETFPASDPVSVFRLS